MDLSVLKFGGTSLANIKLMNNAIDKVIKELSLGNKVIVVVSAMAGVTDQLISQVNETTELDNNDKFAEYANIITTGEQISAGLFTLLLQNQGIKARSWLGWQSGIITDEQFFNGNIIDLNCNRLKESLAQDYQVAIITGFQGVTADNRITTLGRGGSDTTAIALAGTLQCNKCKIYTDVEGVYTADPRIVAKARKIESLSFDEMLAYANAGAKVLQAKSVELAKKFKVNIEVLSSFTESSGTLINNSDSHHRVVGIALHNQHLSSDIAKISIIGKNIDKHTKLIQSINDFFGENIVSFTTLATSLDLGIKDENKFNFIRQLHSICNLE